jgi:hypothetical protein
MDGFEEYKAAKLILKNQAKEKIAGEDELNETTARAKIQRKSYDFTSTPTPSSKMP